MTDFLQRVAQTALGLSPSAQPLVASRYAPGSPQPVPETLLAEARPVPETLSGAAHPSGSPPTWAPRPGADSHSPPQPSLNDGPTVNRHDAALTDGVPTPPSDTGPTASHSPWPTAAHRARHESVEASPLEAGAAEAGDGTTQAARPAALQATGVDEAVATPSDASVAQTRARPSSTIGAIVRRVLSRAGADSARRESTVSSPPDAGTTEAVSPRSAGSAEAAPTPHFAAAVQPTSLLHRQDVTGTGRRSVAGPTEAAQTRATPSGTEPDQLSSATFDERGRDAPDGEGRAPRSQDVRGASRHRPGAVLPAASTEISPAAARHRGDSLDADESTPRAPADEPGSPRNERNSEGEESSPRGDGRSSRLIPASAPTPVARRSSSERDSATGLSSEDSFTRDLSSGHESEAFETGAPPAPRRNDAASLTPSTPRRAESPSRPSQHGGAADAVAGHVVRVTIGRIEVRAVTPPAPPAEAPAPPAPQLSLDEYLRQHNGRPR